MAQGQSPTVRRRRLAAELRRIREQRGLTIDQVSERMAWHPTKLSRIETGRRSAPPGDVRALLELYEIAGDEADTLRRLARQARQRGWWEAYKDVLPPVYSTYIGLEAEAVSVRNYECLFIPGLLQTENYARAAIRGVLPQATEEDVDSRVAVRMGRTRLLYSGSLHLWAIMDEAAIRRCVGGPTVMMEQAQHIKELAALPTVTVQVIPYSAGAHPGMPGSFSILEFPDKTDPEVVYIDSAAGDLFMEREEEVARYTVTFEHLRAAALSPADSIQLIMSAVLDSQEVGT